MDIEKELELYKLQCSLHVRQLESRDREIKKLRSEKERLEDLILSLKSHLQGAAK